MIGRGSTQAWLERVLLALLLARERYGLEIAGSVRDAWRAIGGGDTAWIPEGSTYAALRRLERSGLLVGRWVDVGKDRPRRRYYALSPKGRRVAEADRTRQTRSTRAITGIRP